MGIAIRERKENMVKVLQSYIQDFEDVFFVEYRGLSVKSMGFLRSELSKSGAILSVVKNTFLRLAFTNLKKGDEVIPFFTGPNAIVFTGVDSSAAAKVLTTFAAAVPLLVVKGGLVSGQIYDAKKILEYSALPSKVELYAMFARVLNEPVAQLARVLQAVCDARGGV